jgi:hypothetical protein
MDLTWASFIQSRLSSPNSLKPISVLTFHPAPIQRVPRALTPVVKRPERVADHSSLSSAKVNNAWSYTSTPQYVFMPSCLVKHRDNLTFHNLCLCLLSSSFSYFRIKILHAFLFMRASCPAHLTLPDLITLPILGGSHRRILFFVLGVCDFFTQETCQHVRL